MRRLLQASSVLLLAVSPAVRAQRGAGDERASLVQSIDAKRDSYADDRQTDLGLRRGRLSGSRRAARCCSSSCEPPASGEAGVADIPTAFVATFGSGKPIIGILGEFDALPGLSQEAPTPTRHADRRERARARLRPQPVRHWRARSGDRGQGWLRRTGTEGHASLLRHAGRRGRLGQGVHGARGTFNDVDAAVSGTRAIATRRVRRARPGQHHRRSSAFTASRRTPRRRPTSGRSALDGVEAMDHMVNMMREHVPQETRIHYVITRRRRGAERRARLRRGLLLRAPAEHARSSTASGSASSTPPRARRSAPARRWTSR